VPRHPILAALAPFALLFAGGCGERPAGPPEISAADRELGASQHQALLAEFGGRYDGPQARYLARIGERVAGAAGLAGDCTFTLVNSDVVNAFAVPGCYIYLTRGLMGLVTSEAELASVLAHEIGHIAARHTRRREQRSLLNALGVFAVSLTGSEQLTRLAGRAAQYFGYRYSRGQEYESDDLGIRYLAEAGYDPHAAADMLAALARHERFLAGEDARDAAQAIPEWARTHPLTERRIARAAEQAAATGLANDAQPENAAAYLRAVDGLLYGDDPEQGFVRGRRFAHPTMRIAFEAPPGFTLTNSPQTIGISGPAGTSGEFGGVRNPAGSIEDYPIWLARHIAGRARVTVERMERQQVGGVPAVFAWLRLGTARGDVPLAIAAYDGPGDLVYHFLLAAPPGGGDPAAIRALFRSFRTLSAAEAAALVPRVIRVVRTEPGASVPSLAAAMAAERPAALFALLNGVAPDARLAPGQPVKLVVPAARRP
jgi:predicted Zn-dependent protease